MSTFLSRFFDFNNGAYWPVTIILGILILIVSLVFTSFWFFEKDNRWTTPHERKMMARRALAGFSIFLLWPLWPLWGIVLALCFPGLAVWLITTLYREALPAADRLTRKERKQVKAEVRRAALDKRIAELEQENQRLDAGR